MTLLLFLIGVLEIGTIIKIGQNIGAFVTVSLIFLNSRYWDLFC